jgi:hypothetical protein
MFRALRTSVVRTALAALAPLAALGAAPAALAGSASYSGLLNGASPTHHRVAEFNLSVLDSSGTTNTCKYSVQEFSVDVGGTYTLSSTQTGYDGFIALYGDDFNPAAASVNCLAANNDAQGNTAASTITTTLGAGRRYLLVNTTRDSGTQGQFFQGISGPGSVILGPSAKHQHVVNLTAQSPTFRRPVANADQAPVVLAGPTTFVAYHVLKFRVTAPGDYAISAFCGRGGLDSVLFLYAGDFSPLAPLANCLEGNDDQVAANPSQSGFSANLQPSNVYYLVTCAYSAGNTGKAEVVIAGPGEVETARACPADYNFNGAVDLLDIFDFLTAWFVGCP